MLEVGSHTATVELVCRACRAPIPRALSAVSTPLECASCGRVYPAVEGIILLEEAPNQADYDEQFYSLLAQTEPKHFWFRGRRKTILRALREALGELSGLSVLDVGCGTGFVLQGMVDAGMKCAGIDMFMEGLRHARRRSDALLICNAAGEIPFDEQFDVVTLCDVIEHVDDDRELIMRSAGAAKPGGLILITVPAQQSLWSDADEAWGHKRRYSRESLCETLCACGLSPLFVRYFNSLLHPAQLLQRRRAVRSVDAEGAAMVLTRRVLTPPPRLLDHVLEWSLLADPILRRAGVRLGTSLLAVAKVS
jgi:2-polyprenyl-3-methyl-5-hydroxy-6-metoxy-1,4-benzoquinol methylase